MSDIDVLLDEDAYEKKYPIHEEYTWKSLKNPREFLRLITHFCMFIAISSGLALFFIGFMINFSEVWQYGILWYFITPLFIFFTGQYAIRKNWVKDKNNTLLNRRTGLITFTFKRQRVSYPFPEFTVAIRHNAGEFGIRYHLFLYHAATGHFCMDPGGSTDEWKIEIEWEILQQYMDISQPLPDIPRMECFRERDPFTAQWDKDNHRPQHYWRDTPIEEAETLKEKSIAAAKTFPWGNTREQALQLGWVPSGIGDGDWKTHSS